ncbi:MAG TPA: copper homeostasis protein CutC [Gemmatimonadaceae bacterium]
MVEAAVDTFGSALAAERAGVGRIELCADLNDGGTTPSAGFIAGAAARLRIPVFALIRPRGGDFIYSDDEFDVMRRDIDVAGSVGARGYATGALKPDYTIDTARITSLVRAAGQLPVTFHRAFDYAPDLAVALEQVIDCGVARVLTSGGARTAVEGAGVIARLVSQAGSRIGIVAGGGVRESNIREIIARTGVREVHAGIGSVVAGASPPIDRGITLRKPFPPGDMARVELDEKRMRKLVDLADSRSTST